LTNFFPVGTPYRSPEHLVSPSEMSSESLRSGFFFFPVVQVFPAVFLPIWRSVSVKGQFSCCSCHHSPSAFCFFFSRLSAFRGGWPPWKIPDSPCHAYDVFLEFLSPPRRAFLFFFVFPRDAVSTSLSPPPFSVGQKAAPAAVLIRPRFFFRPQSCGYSSGDFFPPASTF